MSHRLDGLLTLEDGPLPASHWNFTNISDDELIACCLWEYARESRTLALASAVHQMNTRHIRPDNVPEPTKETLAQWAKQDARTRRQVKRERFNYDKFLARYWASDFGHLRFYDLLCQSCSGNAQPFQMFPKELRRYLVNQLTESTLLEPLTEALVCDLERLWKENSAELLEIRGRVRPPNDDSEDFALYDRSRPIVDLYTDEKRSDRTRTVAFTIDFSRFADAEIEAAFHRWVVAHRPRRWRKPAAIFPNAPRRGRKTNDYRVALERLGLMRLLHGITPSDMRKQIPSAWKIYGHKEPDFRREVRAAVRFFRERFPFLPQRERPSSERRFSTWFRPVQKKLEKLNAEWGIK